MPSDCLTDILSKSNEGLSDCTKVVKAHFISKFCSLVTLSKRTVRRYLYKLYRSGVARAFHATWWRLCEVAGFTAARTSHCRCKVKQNFGRVAPAISQNRSLWAGFLFNLYPCCFFRFYKFFS